MACRPIMSHIHSHKILYGSGDVSANVDNLENVDDQLVSDWSYGRGFAYGNGRGLC